MMLLVLVPPVVVLLGRDGVIASAEETSGFGFAAKVDLDHLIASGILDDDVQELPHHARGLVAEHVDERFTVHATDEGIDDVSVSDVGELIVLLGETLDVLLEGLISPLPIVAEVP